MIYPAGHIFALDVTTFGRLGYLRVVRECDLLAGVRSSHIEDQVVRLLQSGHLEFLEEARTEKTR